MQFYKLVLEIRETTNLSDFIGFQEVHCTQGYRDRAMHFLKFKIYIDDRGGVYKPSEWVPQKKRSELKIQPQIGLSSDEWQHVRQELWGL